MFCKYCGKLIPDDTKVCPYCDRKTNQNEIGNSVYSDFKTNPNGIENRPYSAESKTGMGVLLCLFLGFLGLIIGLLLYSAGTYERESFISGWSKCFFAEIIIGLILGVIMLPLCGKLL